MLATMSEAATGHATEDQSSGPCHCLGTSVVFIALILVTPSSLYHRMAPPWALSRR